ncbi:MAG: hypothetical protein ACRC62_28055 [Microcoleus sp.]
MTSIQQRLGQNVDLRAELRGVNFKMLRFDEDTIIKPNPIIHHLGVQIHGEHTSALVDPEAFNTYIAKVPKEVLEDAMCCDITAIAPNSKWYISHDGGTTWVLLRQLGDINCVSPARYHITLVEKGV